ncbi:GNAT family N-acetyltransferase [Cohnella candidum]|uniref:N-acetyltransferase n=1 Tax=Cohnella candidum TaxID=2674991 RepID=A0A3G3JTX0_9BACL|nr:GNAT family N-acetyltransferase [Cohnella candidum]AYQ71291.1 N-acetyltransferase [Cohnella candidum]
MNFKLLDLSDIEIAEELWALQHAAYRREAELIGVADLPPLRDTVQSLQQCGETFYGAVADDGTLAGAVSVEEESDGRRVVCRLMVHPEHFRQGIGGSLLRHAISEAPDRVWNVTAEARNEPALRLYERAGFRSVGSFRPAPNIEMIQLQLERN